MPFIAAFRVPREPHHSAPPSDDDRLELVRADLRARLRVACAHMAPADFAVLVDTMARRALRWSTSPEAEAHLPPA